MPIHSSADHAKYLTVRSGPSLELKKLILRSRAASLSPNLHAEGYRLMPTRDAFFRDIEARVRFYNATLPAPFGRFQSEVEQLGQLLMYHTRTRWTKNVFSLADRAISLQGIYRQSGHVMRCVSRSVAQCTLRDCVAFQFARALHWTAARKMGELTPMRMPNMVPSDQALLDTRMEQTPGHDIGDVFMNRCKMSEHGVSTDERHAVIENADVSVPRGNILWLLDSEAARHRIIIRDGELFFATTGLPLDTSGEQFRSMAHVAGPRMEPFRERDLGSAGYVLSQTGALYAGVHAPHDTPADCMGKHPYFHSSYLSGSHERDGGRGNVLCAGRIFVRNGKLVGIDNASGHYQPSADHLRRAVRDLERQGVPLDGLYCEDVGRTNRIASDPTQGPYTMLWPQARDFLDGREGGPLPREQILALSTPLRQAVSNYRESRGIFSSTSTETQAALRILGKLESDDGTFCTSCVWYAFSPGVRNDDKRWLGHALDYVQSKAFVQMMPLEVGGPYNTSGLFSRKQRFKSGLRTALRAVLPEELVQVVGVYDN